MELVGTFGTYMCLAALTVRILWRYNRSSDRLGYLPGPRGIPVFGNTFQLDSQIVWWKSDRQMEIQLKLDFHQWAKQYGSMYRLRLPVGDMVVVSDYRHMRECLINKGGDFAGRVLVYYCRYLELSDSGPPQQEAPSAVWCQSSCVPRRNVTRLWSAEAINKLEITPAQEYCLNPDLHLNGAVLEPLPSTIVFFTVCVSRVFDGWQLKNLSDLFVPIRIRWVYQWKYRLECYAQTGMFCSFYCALSDTNRLFICLLYTTIIVNKRSEHLP